MFLLLLKYIIEHITPFYFLLQHKVVCEDPPDMTSGTYNLVTNGTATIGQLTCDVGSSVKGGSFISCDSNGKWNIYDSTISCGKFKIVKI